MNYSYRQLAVPAVLCLVSFLAFSSQYLFHNIEPGPLSQRQTIRFNALVIALLICYARAILTDPGHIPSDWVEDSDKPAAPRSKQRWCRKCEAVKPPRAHHCKICKRCIPKMDHHCPWTVNCVSHITFPHFIRFVGYAVAAISYLEYFLYIRVAIIWGNKDLSSNFGPSIAQLVHIFMLFVANSFTLFMLAILLIRSLWSLVVNTFTIEGWEQERHDTLIRRSHVFGGWLDGPDGTRVRMVRQEYPYDIGFWSNIVQGMGTSNILTWFWPFAASPSIYSAIHYQTNGFEDPVIGWPPPDPDRMPRTARSYDDSHAFSYQQDYGDDEIVAFRLRQQEDLKRFNQNEASIRKRPLFHTRYTAGQPSGSGAGVIEKDLAPGEEGEESWRNSEGDRLADYGVDEDVEFYDEEDIPLAELIQRRKLEPTQGSKGQLHDFDDRATTPTPTRHQHTL